MTDDDQLGVVAATCGGCGRPIVAFDVPGGRWLAPPVTGPAAARCPAASGPHIARSGGFIVAGILDPNRIAAEAVALAEMAWTIVEANHHRQTRAAARRAA